MQTLYWYDLETYGLNPSSDWPVQFAGIRTDLALNIIDEPTTLFCQLPKDKLPNPEACLITGFDPLTINAQNDVLPEPLFIHKILQQFTQSETCIVGYNNIRFDDEVIRFTAYRNFYDPYAHEWQHGNSRWDLLDIVRATHALRPEGIHWAYDDSGAPIFKLETLTKINQIEHTQAHTALSDIYATIAIAKQIKEKQPRLFDYFFNKRFKQAYLPMIDTQNPKPFIHISGRYAASQDCLAITLPICWHPTQKHKLMVYHLHYDPEQLIHSSVDEILEWLYTPTLLLQEKKQNPIGLKLIHLNKCPIIAPMTVLRPQDHIRLKLNHTLYQAHTQTILNHLPLLQNKLKDALLKSNHQEKHSHQLTPESALYHGGFITPKDRAICHQITHTTRHALQDHKALSAIHHNPFSENRLNQLWSRFKGRYFYNQLSENEKNTWQQETCTLLTQNISSNITLDQYFEMLGQCTRNTTNETIINQLTIYGKNIKKYFDL